MDTGLAQARRWGTGSPWAAQHLRPCVTSQAADPPAGDSACCPLRRGPGWSSEYGGCWGGPCTCPALVTVTSQPAPDQPRKPYCPCRLGSFLFLMKMSETHRRGGSFHSSPTRTSLSSELRREFPREFLLGLLCIDVAVWCQGSYAKVSLVPLGGRALAESVPRFCPESCSFLPLSPQSVFCGEALGPSDTVSAPLAC